MKQLGLIILFIAIFFIGTSVIYEQGLDFHIGEYGQYHVLVQPHEKYIKYPNSDTILVQTYDTKKVFDTIINTSIYSSYYSYRYKAPVYVTYKLFKGGGECDRKKFKFKNDSRVPSASKNDYRETGLDEGHLVPAEDFAYDCDADEQTFRFYNCVPQTPSLNRGAWRSWENKVRKLSQKDSLYIITGNIFSPLTMGNGVGVPSYCWKVVQRLKDKKIVYVIICPNTEKAKCDTIQLSNLEQRIETKLPLAN